MEKYAEMEKKAKEMIVLINQVIEEIRIMRMSIVDMKIELAGWKNEDIRQHEERLQYAKELNCST